MNIESENKIHKITLRELWGLFFSKLRGYVFSEMDKELPSKINAPEQSMSLELNTPIPVEVQSSEKYFNKEEVIFTQKENSAS